MALKLKDAIPAHHHTNIPPSIRSIEEGDVIRHKGTPALYEGVDHIEPVSTHYARIWLKVHLEPSTGGGTIPCTVSASDCSAIA